MDKKNAGDYQVGIGQAFVIKDSQIFVEIFEFGENIASQAN